MPSEACFLALIFLLSLPFVLLPSDKLYTPEQKARCVIWYIETQSPTQVGINFRREWGRNSQAPSDRAVKRWYQKFLNTGSVLRKKKEGNKQVTCELMKCQESTSQISDMSLRRKLWSEFSPSSEIRT
jgi:hypothetical protein